MMRLADIMSSSWRGLARARLRAALAVLSVAAGAGTLVTIMAGEQAWQRALDAWYEARGVDVIQVGSSRRLLAGLPDSAEATRGLLAACPAVAAASPIAEGWLAVRGRGALGQSRVAGVLPGFERVFGTQLLRGRLLTEEDEQTRARVCVLDAAAAGLLFGRDDPLGKPVRVAGYPFQVVGLVRDLSRGGLGEPRLIAGGSEVYQDEVDRFEARLRGLAVPLSTARHALGLSVSRLAARASDHPAAVKQLARDLRLTDRAASDDPVIWSMASEKAAAMTARSRARVFVAFTALLILLSSGLGLTSVMYVAINDRHREIGIVRACGATRTAVGSAVVLESVWMGLLGLAAGAGLGALGVKYLGTVGFPLEFAGSAERSLNEAVSAPPGMHVSLVWQALLTASAASLASAVLASYLPAGDAAAVSPSEAMRSSRSCTHRSRAALTLVQVAVGVASLLLLTSMHEGIALEQLGQITRFAQSDTVTTALTTTPHREDMPAVATPLQALLRHPTELVAIARECPALRSVDGEAFLWGNSYPLRSGRSSLGGPESGFAAVTAGYLPAERPRLVEGRLFTPGEVAAGKRVLVLTDKAASRLNLDDAAGAAVRVGGIPFQVVGVVAEGVEGASEYAYLPLPSIPASWTSGFPYTASRIRAHLRAKSNIGEAERQLLHALGTRLPRLTIQHLELHGNLPDRYRLTGLRRAAAIRASILGFSALLIALIGLVNMLLVSVAERTREIGLRRALGATRAAIARAVIMEALLICVPGCLAGLGLGIAASRLLGYWAHLATAVPAFWIVVSAGTALAGGLVVSLLPAFRASFVAPVVALRHE